jgi:hypothetical protein
MMEMVQKLLKIAYMFRVKLINQFDPTKVMSDVNNGSMFSEVTYELKWVTKAVEYMESTCCYENRVIREKL